MSLSGAQKIVLVSNTVECKATCLNDCSCTAYAYKSNSCLIWNGDPMSLQQLPLNDSSGKLSSGFAGFLGLFVFVALRRRRKKMVRAGKSMEDPRLKGNTDPERLIRVRRLACWCIQYEETQRPSMGQIVQILEGLINVNLPPLPRLFLAFVDNPDEIISSTIWSSSAESPQASNGMSTASSRPIRPEVGGNADEVVLIGVYAICPKVADFSLAKLVGRDFSRVLMTMRGIRVNSCTRVDFRSNITAKA
ncbi:hypothetical protein FEM48_Zijuj04G0079500 [Ziziphus jujuba var. spinosa]|uniref:Apple domain-containing protein n=1 Tax=Ziziphus jujuba var. spinosa TaxID=714518 RepID=A0A978VIP8_ZIZJJ|nr:hypothetical protein FEM48_Zijuj04G0079500 [Ziziphus jujuba var. spinosa]